MVIKLENISKRYGFEWIFKQVNYQFEGGEKYAIVGPNGSGKSTLLKVISGGLMPTSGNIKYGVLHKRDIDAIDVAEYISFAAPYISLIEEFTLEEFYDFHASFKKMMIPTREDFLSIAQLLPHRKKYIKNFSSGMRQRLKLSVAILTASDVLLLDEPTSNFDSSAIDWYLNMVEEYTKDKLVIIGSNQEHEYGFIQKRLSVADYKS